MELIEPMDPRLAALYDDDNPDGPDHDHYRALADRLGAESIIDLGCGTGLLTVTLAIDGRRVVGIDPDGGMLDVARRRVGTERVEWILGDSRDIPIDSFDLAIMTGNAAMHIGPDDWMRTLADIARGLRSGGALAFETRNPSAEQWRTWTPELTTGTRDTADGPLTEWLDITEPDVHGTVVLTAMNRFDATGEEVVITQPLTFRSLDRLAADLDAAGLDVIATAGGWAGESLTDDSFPIVLEARRR